MTCVPVSDSPRRLNLSPLSRKMPAAVLSSQFLFCTSYAPGPGATEADALKRLSVCAENMLSFKRVRRVNQRDKQEAFETCGA